MVKTKWGSVCITGQYRENNEDAFVIHPEGRYFIVADGMGGQSAGERASALAIELIPQKLDQLIDFDNDDTRTVLSSIDEAIAYANAQIMALSEIEPECHNMGTTAAFIVSVAGKLFVGGVGDSRVYLARGDSLAQLTTDHSLTQALLDAGTINEQEAATHRYRNVLYRYLGTKEGGTGTDAREMVPEVDDRFVVCSDGVTDGIDDAQLFAILKQHDDPQDASATIVAAAEQGGSKDNITCLAIHITAAAD